MDRIDAMKVFVVALDEGSLAGAGRKLGRSPAAVSRAIAFLEARVGSELLHRTTRSIKLSEAGERYAAACRRVLTELEEANIIAAGEKSAPRGTLTLTAPVLSGEMVLRPILDAFLDACPTVSARLLLLDRPVNLIDEGIDVALRIGNLADSSMVATRVGEVRRRGGGCAALPQAASAHRGAGRSDETPDRYHGPSWPILDLSAAAGLFRPTNGSVRAPARDQQHPRGGGLGRRRAGRRPVFFLSGRRTAAPGRTRKLYWPATSSPLPVHMISPQGRLSVPKYAPSSISPCPGFEVISRGWPRTSAIAAPPFVCNAEGCRSPDAYSLASTIELQSLGSGCVSAASNNRRSIMSTSTKGKALVMGSPRASAHLCRPSGAPRLRPDPRGAQPGAPRRTRKTSCPGARPEDRDGYG